MIFLVCQLILCHWPGTGEPGVESTVRLLIPGTIAMVIGHAPTRKKRLQVQVLSLPPRVHTCFHDFCSTSVFLSFLPGSLAAGLSRLFAASSFVLLGFLVALPPLPRPTLRKIERVRFSFPASIAVTSAKGGPRCSEEAPNGQGRTLTIGRGRLIYFVLLSSEKGNRGFHEKVDASRVRPLSVESPRPLHVPAGNTLYVCPSSLLFPSA